MTGSKGCIWYRDTYSSNVSWTNVEFVWIARLGLCRWLAAAKLWVSGYLKDTNNIEHAKDTLQPISMLAMLDLISFIASSICRSLPKMPPRTANLYSPAHASKADTLVLYVFSNTDKEYLQNLQFFLRHGVKEDDGCDYVIVIQIGNTSKVAPHFCHSLSALSSPWFWPCVNFNAVIFLWPQISKPYQQCLGTNFW